MAGSQKGLNDDRGNLTLKFVDIVNNNDEFAKKIIKIIVLFSGKMSRVLKDKTNALVA